MWGSPLDETPLHKPLLQCINVYNRRLGWFCVFVLFCFFLPWQCSSCMACTHMVDAGHKSHTITPRRTTSFLLMITSATDCTSAIAFTKRVVQRFLGEGGEDSTIPSPRVSPKQPPLGKGLRYPLHGRQASPEITSFPQGVVQICPREGLFSCRPHPKQGQICDTLPLIR